MRPDKGTRAAENFLLNLRKKPRRILLVGYGGLGNLGDDLLKEAAVLHLPEDCAVRSCSPRNAWKLLNGSDLVYFYGGAIFVTSGLTSYLKFFYFPLLLIVAKIMGVKVVVDGIQISESDGLVSIVSFYLFARLCNFISCRDAFTFRIAGGAGRKEVRIEKDPVEILARSFIKINYVRKSSERIDFLYLPSTQGVQYKSDDVFPGLDLQEAPNSRKGIAMCFTLDDAKRAKNFFGDRVKVIMYEGDSIEAIKLFMCSELVVTERFHCWLLARALGINFLVPQRSAKLDAYIRTWGD